MAGFIGVKSLFHPGFYTSHDGRHQVVRLAHFQQGLLDGQFPVRWAGSAFNGYGYPLFIFTYRLPFWIAEFWYKVSNSLTESIKFTFILTYILSGFSMYWFANTIWKNRLGSFLAAILYLWAPYRFVDIYVRAALGEAVTFVFIPLFFLGTYYLKINNKKGIPYFFLSIFALAGILLSHSMTLWLWSIPLGLWIIFNLYLVKNKKDYFQKLFLIFITTLLLTSYYWLPAFFEKQFTKFTSSINDYYKSHFVTFSQLLYSKWGYGFSMGGTKNDGMSFQIGIAQWFVYLSAILSLIFILIKNKLRKIVHFFPSLLSSNKVTFIWLFYFMTIFLLAIYFMLERANWYYVLINKVMPVDIPWRFLGVTVFAISALAGGIISIIKNNLVKGIFIVLILILAFYGNRNHLNVNQYTYYSDSEYWQDQETSNEYNDYAPKWFINQNESKDVQLTTIQGISTNKLIERKSNFFRFYSEVQSNKAEIVTRVAYYPGWNILVDGKTEQIAHKDGKIKVDLEKGNHLITLIFKETNLRLFSDWLSLITLFFLLGWVFKNYKFQK